MINRREWLLNAAGLAMQAPGEAPVEWVCPMDPDVRSPNPGACPRCKMALVAGIPTYVEWPMRLTVEPAAWKAGQRVRMRFEVLDPKTGRRAGRLLVVHERLFHLFLVSGDLSFFAHEHPEMQADGTFLFETVLPRRGFYRVAGDYYPEGGSPQMALETIVSLGAKQMDFQSPRLAADLKAKAGANLKVSLRTAPEEPIAGLKTMLFFDLAPGDGVEPYLGAWGHLIAASADLIDVIHTHPFIADGGPQMQFNVAFPRPGSYRVWAQFQRQGTVNTAAFTVPVKALGGKR
jgi:hypothetical protein